MAECFRSLLSSLSNDSARSIVSPYPWSKRQQPLLGYLALVEIDYSRVLLRTFIHCSVRRIDSNLRATIAGLMRSSARSSSPSRLAAAVSHIGDKRIGSVS
jgi:hypothetical protein